MTSKDEQIKHVDKELDLSNAGRGVWLVNKCNKMKLLTH